jgi:hypothetical protein
MNIKLRSVRHLLALFALLPIVSFGQTCGPADGTIRLTAPTTGLCATGNPSVVSGTGPFFWYCLVGTSFENCSTRPHCHDVDGNGQIHATSDGLIINRVMLGMTGTAVSSAAQPGAPRSTWTSIRNFLAASCGYTNLVCTPNGQTISIAPQPNIQSCIDAIIPAATTQCCVGTLTVITFDNPMGSNSCVGTCGAPIGAAPEAKLE